MTGTSSVTLSCGVSLEHTSGISRPLLISVWSKLTCRSGCAPHSRFSSKGAPCTSETHAEVYGVRGWAWTLAESWSVHMAVEHCSMASPNSDAARSSHISRCRFMTFVAANNREYLSISISNSVTIPTFSPSRALSPALLLYPLQRPGLHPDSFHKQAKKPATVFGSLWGGFFHIETFTF